MALSLDAVGPLALLALRDQLQDGAREAAAELHRAGKKALFPVGRFASFTGGGWFNLFIIYLFSLLFTYILIYLFIFVLFVPQTVWPH